MSQTYDGHSARTRVNEIMQRNRTNLINTVMERVNNAPYPSMAEPAVVHPYHNSVIKLRNNGMIDVFVDKDTGIRIDPKTTSINMFAGVAREMFGHVRSHISKTKQTNIGLSWNIRVGTEFNVIAGSAINFTAPIIRLKGQVQCPGHFENCPYRCGC